jgi:hypothetical protein
MSWTEHRARVASLTRSRPPDDPDLLDARRELAVARLELRIRDALAHDPPFTNEQRVRLANLIASYQSKE